MVYVKKDTSTLARFENILPYTGVLYAVLRLIITAEDLFIKVADVVSHCGNLVLPRMHCVRHDNWRTTDA